MGADKLGENHNSCPSKQVATNTKHNPARVAPRPAIQGDKTVITTVFTDASFCHQTRCAGYAVWVKNNSRVLKRYGNFRGKPENSSDAEFMALINGIYFAMQLAPETTYLIVQTDCMGIIPHANRGGLPQRASGRLKRRMREALKGVTLDVRHVKAHSRDGSKRSHVNNWCDEFARKAMRQQRGRQ